MPIGYFIELGSDSSRERVPLLYAIVDEEPLGSKSGFVTLEDHALVAQIAHKEPEGLVVAEFFCEWEGREPKLHIRGAYQGSTEEKAPYVWGIIRDLSDTPTHFQDEAVSLAPNGERDKFNRLVVPDTGNLYFRLRTQEHTIEELGALGMESEKQHKFTF